MLKKRGLRNHRAQIWVETVVYTLIGLTLMAIILGVVTPKINQIKDKAILSQTADTLSKFNDQFQDSLSAAGSQREVLLSVTKGEYTIEPSKDIVYFKLRDTTALKSQVNESVREGDIIIFTKEVSNKKYEITMTLNYSSYNLTFNGRESSKTLTAAPTPYKLLIVNEGVSPLSGIKKVDIRTIGS